MNRSLNGKKYGCCRLSNGTDKVPPRNYICVEKDEAFQIQIGTIDGRDKNTYGSVLFLDGQVSVSIC